MKNNKCKYQYLINKLWMGELSEKEKDFLLKHIGECSICKVKYKVWLKLHPHFSNLKSIKSPPELYHKIKETIQTFEYTITLPGSILLKKFIKPILITVAIFLIIAAFIYYNFLSQLNIEPYLYYHLQMTSKQFKKANYINDLMSKVRSLYLNLNINVVLKNKNFTLNDIKLLRTLPEKPSSLNILKQFLSSSKHPMIYYLNYWGEKGPLSIFINIENKNFLLSNHLYIKELDKNPTILECYYSNLHIICIGNYEISKIIELLEHQLKIF